MNTALLILLLSPAAVLGSSEPQREELLFNQADKDHDGSLTRGDLHQVFLDFDVNHDGNITQAEFLEDWTHQYHLGNNQEALTLFTRADVDHDDVITARDLPSIFNFFDMDGNHQVDRNEFLTQWGDLRLNVPDTVTFQLSETTTQPDSGHLVG